MKKLATLTLLFLLNKEIACCSDPDLGEFNKYTSISSLRIPPLIPDKLTSISNNLSALWSFLQGNEEDECLPIVDIYLAMFM